MTDAALKKAKLENLRFHEYFTTKFWGDGKQDPDAHILLFRRLCEDLKYIPVAREEGVPDLETVKKNIFQNFDRESFTLV